MRLLGSIFFLTVFLVQAAVAINPVLSRYFVVPKDDATMQKIADLFEVRARRQNGFEVIVPAHRAEELRALAPNSQLLEADISEIFRRLERSAPEWLAAYHTFDQVQAALKKMALDHPDIAQFETYGKSKEGRPLMSLRLGNGNGTRIMITSATHGDELITVEVLLGLMEALLKNYGTDRRLTNLLDKYELFFIPVVNPDGFVIRSRYANGVDPNREYPWPENQERNPNECIKHLIAYFHAHKIAGSIDFHSSGGLFMYPWSYTRSSTDPADERVFNDLTRRMASTNGYQSGQISRILYIAKGASADYYYWKNKTIAIATEVGNSNVPSPSAIPGIVQNHLESTWLFIEHF